jgi:hypothetical protein
VYSSTSRASVVTRTPRFSRPRVLPFGTINIRHTFEQPREIDTVGRYLSTCSAAAPHESVCAVVIDVHFRFECHAVFVELRDFLVWFVLVVIVSMGWKMGFRGRLEALLAAYTFQ